MCVPISPQDSAPLSQGGLAAYGREATIGRVWPLSYSRDGRFLVYASNVGGLDVWALPLQDEGTPIPIQHSQYTEEDAALSADGRWLAYTSNRSGRSEIYLTAFPESGRSWQVSADGGIRPEWGVGGELFFLDLGDNLRSVGVTGQGDSVSISEVRELFRLYVRHHVLYEPGAYAVAPDGERFLVNRVTKKGTADPIQLIVGWPALLD